MGGGKIKKYKSNSKLLYIIVAIILMFISYNYFKKVIYPLKYSDYVYKYSYEYNIDPYLVFSIIKAESNFDPNAVSHKGAKGLMQIMDETATWIAASKKNESFHTEDVYQPNINIKYGCWLINSLNNEFDDKINLVLASYNAGSGNVKKWIAKIDNNYIEDDISWIEFIETKNYVIKVNKYYEIYKDLYDKE